jgi:hypothetical protein
VARNTQFSQPRHARCRKVVIQEKIDLGDGERRNRKKLEQSG